MALSEPVVQPWSAIGRKIKFEKTILYVLDLLLAAVALGLAMVLRIGPAATFEDPGILILGLFVFVPICAVSFPLSGLYARHWRYASLHDLLAITRAVAVSSLLFLPALFVITRLDNFPRSVAFIEASILILMLGGARLVFRIDEVRRIAFSLLGTAEARQKDKVPVLLIGAGSPGEMYARALSRDPNAAYTPIGFLDDNPANEGISIRGINVLGRVCDLESALVKLRRKGRSPQRIIFTDSDASKDTETSQWVIKVADEAGIAVSRVPSPTELRDPLNHTEVGLKSIQLTDLLERPQNRLDRKTITDFIRGRRIVVTGAGGSIGSELVKQIAALDPAEIVMIDNSEYNLYAIDHEVADEFPDLPRFAHLCDIRIPHRVDEIFDRHSPQLVFNAAALKHVPLVEGNPCEGFLTNVVGSQNVAEAAKRCNVDAFVQISTDKAVDSTSVMGATKRIAELFCQALDLEEKTNCQTRFMTVRFGNVLGSSGSLIPLFQRQLARGGPLTVTDPNMTRFFMTIREAVELTLQSSAHGLAKNLGQGEVFVLDMGEPVKIIDIANRMIRLAGLTPQKDIEISIIGCRPGEKLFEELFDDAEKRVDVGIPGVLGALPQPMELSFLRERISQMKYLARTGNVDRLFRVMMEILPRYEPESLREARQRAAETEQSRNMKPEAPDFTRKLSLKQGGIAQTQADARAS